MEALYIILIVLGIFILWQILIRLFRKLVHFPAPAFIGRLLDSNFRRWEYPPNRIIERSGIKQGMYVLELGCGSGSYTTYMARVVGADGKIYALDIESKMLKQLENKLAKPENKDINNVELVNKSAYELPFPDNSLDLVYTVTVLEEIPDKHKALSEVWRVLKPGGLLAVTEQLIDPDFPLKSTTVKLGQAAGFVLDSSKGNLWTYTVRFKKP